MRLLLGTTNVGKIRDYKTLLSDLPIDIVTPNDLGITEKPEETGETFEENARIKAQFYLEKSGLMALGDDGGFEIDALGGAPGVYSRRWPFLEMGEDREATDEELIQYALKKMEGVPKEKRGAQLRAIAVLRTPEGDDVVGEGKNRGVIAEKPREQRIRGFPFRDILWIPERNKFFGDFTDAEHQTYNHRVAVLQPIKTFLSRKLATRN